MSPEARLAILKNWLVGLKGEPGHEQHLDMVVEHLILLLDNATRHRKNAAYDSPWVRNVLSPNLTHLQTFSASWLAAVDLAAKKGHHPDPSTDPELRDLLAFYRTTELHRFRAHRSYSPGETTATAQSSEPPAPPRAVDDFARGMARLQTGRLRKWVGDTTAGRGLVTPSDTTLPTVSPSRPAQSFDMEFEELFDPTADDLQSQQAQDALDAALASAEASDSDSSKGSVHASPSDVDSDNDSNNSGKDSSSSSSEDEEAPHEDEEEDRDTDLEDGTAPRRQRFAMSFQDGNFFVSPRDDDALEVLARQIGEMEDAASNPDSDSDDTDVHDDAMEE
jgi:hypothetical protein